MKKIYPLILFLTIFAFNLSSQKKQKLLWFDATANWTRLSFGDSISFYLDKAKELGFTDVVVDIKPITGEVLYPSNIAPQMKDWQEFSRPNELDFLNEFIDESHKRNLKVHASLNVFVAGHNYFDRGLVYQDKQNWQSINYTDSGLVPISLLKKKYSAMTNPANREVQIHELSVIKELVSNYSLLDGIILDRVRYDCIEADFSLLSKTLFENYIGETVDKFPQDIFEWTKKEPNLYVKQEGKYFKKWIEWRASVIYYFIKEAREEVKKINPKISFGVYTGAWYPVYYEVGVNWASKNYDTSLDYNWASELYKDFGYAELLDLYTTGCYFFEVTKDEVEKLNEQQLRQTETSQQKGKEYWYSVEGSAEFAMKLTNGVVPVFGGLYVEQYKDHPEQFKKAVQMCLQKTNGLMIFDIVHIINYNWWNVLKEGMK
jgi:hypothetical protein